MTMSLDEDPNATQPTREMIISGIVVGVREASGFITEILGMGALDEPALKDKKAGKVQKGGNNGRDQEKRKGPKGQRRNLRYEELLMM